MTFSISSRKPIQRRGRSFSWRLRGPAEARRITCTWSRLILEVDRLPEWRRRIVAHARDIQLQALEGISAW